MQFDRISIFSTFHESHFELEHWVYLPNAPQGHSNIEPHHITEIAHFNELLPQIGLPVHYIYILTTHQPRTMCGFGKYVFRAAKCQIIAIMRFGTDKTHNAIDHRQTYMTTRQL